MMVSVDDSLYSASPARMYNHWLGGKDNDMVDREAADEVAKAAPSIVQAAQANRAFMHRVVAFAAQAGIDQFIDVGTGIPAEPNPHQIAQRHQPDAVVVGVDNDEVVLAHDRALLGRMPIVAGDVRCPDKLIADLDRMKEKVIDWDRPVAVLLLAVLHFVTDAQDPAGIARAFTGRMAPGSMVALSHVSSTGVSPATVAEVERVYRDKATAPGVLRTREQIAALFGRLELVKPGLVPVPHWPRRGRRTLTDLPVLGGVGMVPDPLAERVVAPLQAHIRLVSGSGAPDGADSE